MPYLQFPPAEVKAALLGAGMSEEAASEMVAMQLAVNDQRPFAGLRRAADLTAPTRLEAFLDEVTG